MGGWISRVALRSWPKEILIQDTHTNKKLLCERLHIYIAQTAAKDQESTIATSHVTCSLLYHFLFDNL